MICIINNSHMLTLIMWHNRFSKNENEPVEAHIYTMTSRFRDEKATTSRFQGQKTATSRNGDN